LFLQKQSLAFAVYLFGIGTLHRAFSSLKDLVDHVIVLNQCWRTLDLPPAAENWDNCQTLDFFRVQQHKVAAFASGLHGRLGQGLGVLELNEKVLVMIADEVLGG
jgi:hypothetical protein